MSSYDSIFVAFFRKVFAYCVAYAKEKKEKLETLLDWLRRLVIRKEKSLKIVLTILEDEFINLLNALGKFIKLILKAKNRFLIQQQPTTKTCLTKS